MQGTGTSVGGNAESVTCQLLFVRRAFVQAPLSASTITKPTRLIDQTTWQAVPTWPMIAAPAASPMLVSEAANPDQHGLNHRQRERQHQQRFESAERRVMGYWSLKRPVRQRAQAASVRNSATVFAQRPGGVNARQ